MVKNPGRYKIDKEISLGAMGGDFLVEKYSAKISNDPYWGVQAILDRRKSQTGKFWRETQAGELLRRELSKVEIICIAFIITATLVSHF